MATAAVSFGLGGAACGGEVTSKSDAGRPVDASFEGSDVDAIPPLPPPPPPPAEDAGSPVDANTEPLGPPPLPPK